ncbi:MAG: peroxide stress protein YaaA [Bacteroidales bacterium]|nr:peroxide stress protein YaaA [Bacteroidales bacterium]
MLLIISPAKKLNINAKKARGMMCNYIIKNKLTDPADLKEFDYGNYYYNEELSSNNNFIFIR